MSKFLWKARVIAAQLRQERGASDAPLVVSAQVSQIPPFYLMVTARSTQVAAIDRIVARGLAGCSWSVRSRSAGSDEGGVRLVTKTYSAAPRAGHAKAPPHVSGGGGEAAAAAIIGSMLFAGALQHKRRSRRARPRRPPPPPPGLRVAPSRDEGGEMVATTLIIPIDESG